MSEPIRFARPAWVPLLISLALLIGTLSPGALAQAAQEQESGAASSGESQVSKQEQKERAKQARIEEYLRKREERLARKELKEKGVEIDAAGAAVTGAAVATETEEKKKKRQEEDDEVVLPKDLAEAQAIVRGNEIAQDPTVAAYLDLIDRAEASPQQLAAFGNFLSDYGAPRLALVYYDIALGLEPDDAILWLNVGTLHRKVQEYNAALDAFSRALEIDPNLAYAHYNLGATLDDLGKYDAALEEYRIALTLDPSLGDPETNPQATNNERLLAVKLMLYEEQIGAKSLPLVDLPEGGLATPEPEED
jgi:tetratricopeptide (TPR) repeat protein